MCRHIIGLKTIHVGAASHDRQRAFVQRCIAGSASHGGGAFAAQPLATALNRLGRSQRRVFVASVPGEGGRRRDVGVLIKTRRGQELHWAVALECRGRGHGARMVALVAEPGMMARIARADLASAKIAQRAGFNLVEDGRVQLWRADRTPPYA